MALWTPERRFEPYSANQFSTPTMSTLRKLEREMNGPVWRAYMAGRHAAGRDSDMERARKATDPEIRKILASNARREHHYYLKAARVAAGFGK